MRSGKPNTGVFGRKSAWVAANWGVSDTIQILAAASVASSQTHCAVSVLPLPTSRPTPPDSWPRGRALAELFEASRQMAGIDYRAVRSMISMEEVLGLFGFEAQERSGSQLRGACPLHGSSGTSRVFSVNMAKNTFHAPQPACAAARQTLNWE
jgi:hypothetical protein